MKKFSLLILSLTILLLNCTNEPSRNFGAHSQIIKQDDITNLAKENVQKEKSSVGGMVLYPDGKPAPEAVIYAYRATESPFSERVPTTSSDKEGKFKIQLEPGKYQFCAWKQSENYLLPNFLPFGLSVGGKCEDVSVSAGETKQINLTLAPKSNSLVGKVVDWNSIFLPADSMVVLFRPLKLEKNKWVLTTMEEATWDAKAEIKPDKDGNFVINGLPEGTYFLRIELPGNQRWLYKRKNSVNELIPIQIKNNSENKISFSYY